MGAVARPTCFVVASPISYVDESEMIWAVPRRVEWRRHGACNALALPWAGAAAYIARSGYSGVELRQLKREYARASKFGIVTYVNFLTHRFWTYCGAGRQVC